MHARPVHDGIVPETMNHNALCHASIGYTSSPLPPPFVLRLAPVSFFVTAIVLSRIVELRLAPLSLLPA